MRRLVLSVPILAFLAVTLWFVGRAWTRFGAGAIPYYGWLAIGGGIFFSLLVAGGLITLMIYSHTHGYDELNEKDRRNDET